MMMMFSSVIPRCLQDCRHMWCPHMLQTQRLGGRCMYFERTRTSSVQTNCICMLVFFLSGSETGCKGNGDVLHATSLHLEFRTCWLGAMKIKAGSVEPAGWSCNCCNTRGAVKALTGKSKKLQFCCTSVVEIVCHE